MSHAAKQPRPCTRGLGPFERWLVRRILDSLARHDRRGRVERSGEDCPPDGLEGGLTGRVGKVRG